MNQAPILMYHWFRATGAASTSRSPQLEITPERFDRQLAWLRDHGWRGVTLREALAAGETGDRTTRPVAITFDDGTRDFWEHARPALKRHGFRATLFVVTDYVGTQSSWDDDLGEPARPLLSWEQIVDLDRSGFEIGSHTHTHRPLVDLDAETVRDELRRSRERLAERLGHAPAFLAYPRGFYGPEHKRIVQSAGFDGACAVILQWRDLLRSDRYELKRMTIKGDESMLRFRMRLALAQRVRFAAV